jgi:RNA polymerase sigma-70 factor, ECF subfamily
MHLWACSMNLEMKRQALCIAQPEIKLLYQFTARSEKKQARNSAAKRKDSSILWKDKALIARAQNGDRAAFGDLVKMYQGKAYAIAYSMCSGDGEEARELTQEAFLRAFQNLKSFRGKSSFYTWYYRILVNICLDNRRRRGRWNKIFSFWRGDQKDKAISREMNAQYTGPREHSDPMTALNNKQLAKEIGQALASLPEKQRVVFQLKVLHGMQIREIAEVMGSAEGTVKSHLFRATHFMREALQEWAQP